MAANLQLDGIVTLVDAAHIMQQLDKRAFCDSKNLQQCVVPYCVPFIATANSTLNEALEQIGVADRILLNKTDLVTEKVVPFFEMAARPTRSQVALDVKKRLQAINPTAEIITTQYAKVRQTACLCAVLTSLSDARLICPMCWM